MFCQNFGSEGGPRGAPLFRPKIRGARFRGPPRLQHCLGSVSLSSPVHEHTTHLIQTKTSTSRKSYTQSKILFQEKNPSESRHQLGCHASGVIPKRRPLSHYRTQKHYNLIAEFKTCSKHKKILKST